MSYSTITFLILAVAVVVFVWDRLAVAIVAIGPGGYRCTDYWKLGLPPLVLFILVPVLLVPLIWAF